MTKVEPGTILSVTGVTKNYGAHLALDDVGFSLSAGGVVGLIGPNGSGKTTLFNTITGIHQPNKGGVHLGGRNITGMAPETIARLGIARTFQNLKVFRRLTVFDNVLGAQSGAPEMPLWQLLVPERRSEKQRRAKVEQILEQVGLSSRSNILAEELPLGDQRRLEIARALACEPQLMLLDEPAGGMTPQETEEMAKLVRDIAAEGPTVFLIEHKMGMVMSLCRHIIVLNFGQKIAEGTPKEVQADRAVREAYLGSEALHA